MRCVKAENQDGDFCIVPLEGAGISQGRLSIETDLEELTLEGAVGDSFTYTIIEMTDKEFEELPDFMGW